MMRAIVLVACLASAGSITAYTLYSHGDTGEPVYTVPSRSSDPAPPPPGTAGPKRIEADDRAALARELQRELKRVGCYNGEITGVWTTSSRLAMKTFVERVNAALPIDKPDPVLLSLVQGHRGHACGVACPAGQTDTGSGTCVPNAVLAKTAKEPSPDAKSEAERTGAAAGAAAAMAAAGAAAARPKAEAKAAPDAGRPATASQSGPVPPEGTRERRPRRSAQGPRPPKVVRDILNALGIK